VARVTRAQGAVSCIAPAVVSLIYPLFPISVNCDQLCNVVSRDQLIFWRPNLRFPLPHSRVAACLLTPSSNTTASSSPGSAHRGGQAGRPLWAHGAEDRKNI
jgi:hypothetical protein